ncbi:hypothetical protein BC941DRAFT_410559 [Chlamydoabsidia padenii]|nr:hypothetical protein BC941DRAFT_410559 [Chlamydoabsidia padenii]
MLRLTKSVGLPLVLLLATLFLIHLGLERRLAKDSTTLTSLSNHPPSPTTEKYLTYLPHSGLHNQRIALINGVLLALALNRTLILPELNLGTATYWRPTSLLPFRLDECGDEYIHLPAHVVNKTIKGGRPKAWWSANCFDYRHYLPMAVDWIFDLEAVHRLGVRTIQRRDMRLDYFERYWSVPMDERNKTLVYQVLDNARYSYQIIDDDDEGTGYDTSTNTKFMEHYSFKQLEQHQEPFMIFNSLFGSDRLALPSGGSWAHVRETLRQEMGVRQPWVVNNSLAIIDRLGGPGAFIGVHIRMGDGIFKTMQDNTMEQVRQQLIQRQDGNHPINDDDSIATTLASIQSLHSNQDRLTACLELQSHNHIHHHRLGLIYMTTDANSPRTTLPHLFEEFVCLFTLDDFGDIVHSTLALQLPLWDHRHDDENNNNNTAPPPTTQGNILLPLIDAEVAAQASFFVPTPGSTFSGYIEHRNKRFRQQHTFTHH